MSLTIRFAPFRFVFYFFDSIAFTVSKIIHFGFFEFLKTKLLLICFKLLPFSHVLTSKPKDFILELNCPKEIYYQQNQNLEYYFYQSINISYLIYDETQKAMLPISDLLAFHHHQLKQKLSFFISKLQPKQYHNQR